MVKNIFNPETIDHLIVRINNLEPDSKAKWGKMNVCQMMKHCAYVTEVTFGDKQLKRPFVSYLFGKMTLKKIVKDDKPLGKNSPTHADLIIKTTQDFTVEKEHLLALVERFKEKGEEEFENQVHPFFGKMSGREWNISTYKHFDHHLTQFGV